MLCWVFWFKGNLIFCCFISWPTLLFWPVLFASVVFSFTVHSAESILKDTVSLALAGSCAHSWPCTVGMWCVMGLRLDDPVPFCSEMGSSHLTSRAECGGKGISTEKWGYDFYKIVKYMLWNKHIRYLILCPFECALYYRMASNCEYSG